MDRREGVQTTKLPTAANLSGPVRLLKAAAKKRIIPA